ncbi:MAG TPA: sigma factor-like helix-turn-helix DNA-binding protein [Gemmataceae bacterium]|nr:sigma factor-like helix-turn-helix DNA-binding protein [Gemmataceae bacterium]
MARLLPRLGPVERQIVELRLQGRSNEEIAAELGVYERKIRRVFERARELIAEG